MTKFCSKKVLIICLCFTTILASLLIGKNLYQGTPTFQNAFTNKLSDDGDAGEMHQGGRRQIQDNENNLRLDIIRHGGFANDGTNIVQGETGELVPRQEIDENDDSSEASFQKATKNKEMEDDLAKITKQDEAPRIIPPNNNGPFQKWTLESDPRVPRILAKVMSSMPKEVRQDIPQEYLQMGPRKYLGTRFKVVSDAYKKHGMTQRLPEVISIGVKKSGTNAVGFFVTQHPQIVHSVGNEVHFFDRNYQKGLEYYRIRMGFAKEDQFCFEKTPKYFVTPNAPKQILSDLPKNIKFVLSVRDPVKRALSDFRHERELYVRRKMGRNLGRVKSSPEDEGKIFEQQVLDEHGNVNASNMIVDTSYYAKHFKHWLEYFPRDRFLVINLDSLERDAFPMLKKFEQFVGLDPYFKESMFYYDSARHGTCMHGTSRSCPPKSTPGVLPKAEPSDATLKKLYEFYRPSNKEFMQLTGHDFAWARL